MTATKQLPEITVSTWIARRSEVVLHYLEDVAKDVYWRQRVISAEWLSGPPHGLGTKGWHVLQRTGEFSWEVVEFNNPASWTWQVTGGSQAGSQAGYRLESEITAVDSPTLSGRNLR